MTTAREELQAAHQRLADLRREADLMAAQVPSLHAQAEEEQRTAVAADNGAEQRMADELPDWQARYSGVLDAARAALAELVAVSNSYNRRVRDYGVESARGPNPGAIANRGAVRPVTTGANVLRLAADVLRQDEYPDMGSKSWCTDIGRIDHQPAPRCAFDPRP